MNRYGVKTDAAAALSRKWKQAKKRNTNKKIRQKGRK